MTEPNGHHQPIKLDSSNPMEGALAFCERHISAMMRKADHNKRESLRSFYLVIGPSLCAPLFVTLGQEWILGKLVPSMLSLIAAAAMAWLQLRKPQQLWSTYRSAQRELDDQKNRFVYRIGAYADDPEPERLLAKNVADIAIGVHHQWVPLVPSPEQLKHCAASTEATPTLQLRTKK
jgi:hypothetical protein